MAKMVSPGVHMELHPFELNYGELFGTDDDDVILRSTPTLMTDEQSILNDFPEITNKLRRARQVHWCR